MQFNGKQSINSLGEERKRDLPKVKVVIIGASGVGKTSISQRFIADQFNPRTPPTLGGAYIEKVFQYAPGCSLKIQIWDTAGQEKYKSIAKIYYKDAKIAILVYDVNDKHSLSHLQSWGQDLLNNSNKDILLAVVGNKIDLIEDNKEAQDYERLARDYARSIKASFYVTSAKDNKGINQLFTQLCQLLPKRNVPINKPQVTLPLVPENRQNTQRRCCK